MKMMQSYHKLPLEAGEVLDKSGLRALHEQCFRKLYLYALQFTTVPEDAEEVVYDAFMKLWDRRKDLCQVENMEAYLTVTVKNLSLNRLGSSSRKFTEKLQALPAEHLRAHSLTAEEEMCFSELHEALQKAVLELPPQCRKIFQLIKEDGMKYKEVAEILGISINTVDVHLAKAMKALRHALRNYAPKPKGKVVEMDNFKMLATFFIFFLI